MAKRRVINYFRDSWKPNYNKFELSGWNLINKIKETETILDVGCGYNLFKPIFGDRLYGIDPANVEADQIVSIEDFEMDKQWDVLFCLGSLNFGEREEVLIQVQCAVQYLKPGGRIYWRQNPGIGDHPWKGVDEIQFYPWTFGDNIAIANEVGCDVVDLRWDTGSRIYSEWRKHVYADAISH